MASKKTVGKSAPGDALYESLEDFVLDQSEGEESADGELEQERAGKDDGRKEEATGLSGTRNHNNSDNTDQQTYRPPATTQRKRRRRVAYTAHEELVLYLLHTHVFLQHSDRTEIFNRVLPDQLVVREKGALIMQWSRFKDDYKKRYATLSAAELAEHEAWKKKIDQAMKDAAMKSQSDEKQGNDKQGVEKQGNDKQDEGSDSSDDSENSEDSDSGDDRQAAARAYLASQREARPRYTADEELVLYLLYSRTNLDHDTRAKVINHLFRDRDEGIVRNKAALGKHWGRWKVLLQKKYDIFIHPTDLALREAWKLKIDAAIEELSG